MRKLSLLAFVFTLLGVAVNAGPIWALDENGFPPVLEITKSVNRAQADPLEVLTYTITVVNVGAGRADNVIVTDFVPANTDYVQGSTRRNGQVVADLPGGISPLSGGLNVGNLDRFPQLNRTAVVTFQVRVQPCVAAGTIIRNVAQARSDDSETITSEEVQTVIRAVALLAIQKSVAPATAAPLDVVSYTITVRNDGNIAATNVIVTDPGATPTGLDYVPDSTRVNGVSVPDADGGASPLAGGLNVGSIAACATTTVTFRRQVAECIAVATEFSNTASVRSDQTASQNSNTVVVTVTGAVLLTIAKSVDPTSAAPNAVVTYSITVRNRGNLDATNVIVRDPNPNPAALGYVTGSTQVNGVAVPDAAGDASPLEAGLNVGTIASCTTTTVTFQRRVIDCPAAGTVITNTATVASDQTSSQSATASLTILQDITPPVITIVSPTEGQVFERCDTLSGLIRITDECPGVDLASIRVRIGGVQIPITVSPDGTVTFTFNLQNVSIGPLTITVEARDLVGNPATASVTVNIDCSFDCAEELILRAVAANAFKCPHTARTFLDLIRAAERAFNQGNHDLCRRILQELIDCVTQVSREFGANRQPLGGRAFFFRTTDAQNWGRILEEEFRCLLAKC
jgi:uncharacterized repeat protein (TIGR01451 family)